MIDHPEIQPIQAQALATLIHTLRPEWDTRSIYTLIGNHRDTTKQPIPGFPALCQAAITATNTTTNKTPAVIWLPGAHWRNANSEHQPPPGPACEDHETEEARNCRSCWGDVRTGHRPESHIGKAWTTNDDEATK